MELMGFWIHPHAWNAALMKEGMRGRKGIFARKRRPLLQSLEIDEVNRCLSILNVLDKHIKELSAMISGIAGESQEAKWLERFRVGYSVVTTLAEIGAISRFGDPEKLCAGENFISLLKSKNRKSSTRLSRPFPKNGACEAIDPRVLAQSVQLSKQIPTVNSYLPIESAWRNLST